MSANETGSVDEELPSLPPRRRRLVVAAAVVIGLAVVAGVVTRLADADSHSPTASTPAPRTTVERSSEHAPPPPGLSRALPAIAPLRGLTPAEISAAHAHCPRLAPGCQTTGETPAAVLAAIRTQFPHAHHYVAVSDLVYTDENVPFLAYRRLTVQSGHSTVSIEIARSQPGDGVGSQRLGNVVRYQNVANGLTVEIQASTSGTVGVQTTDLQRLAVDRRLTDIG